MTGASMTMTGGPTKSTMSRMTGASTHSQMPKGYLIVVESEEHLQGAIRQATLDDKLTLVNFWAPWHCCGACVYMVNFYERMSNEFEKVLFAKVDIDDNEELGDDFDIVKTPTFVLFNREGVEVERMSGNKVEVLRAMIEKYL